LPDKGGEFVGAVAGHTEERREHPRLVFSLTITHNFRELRARPKGQVVDNKKGAADNKL